MRAYGIPRTYDADGREFAPKTSVRRCDGRSSQRSAKKRRIRQFWKKKARRAGQALIREAVA